MFHMMKQGAQAPIRSKVIRFVLQTQHVNLRIGRQRARFFLTVRFPTSAWPSFCTPTNLMHVQHAPILVSTTPLCVSNTPLHVSSTPLCVSITPLCVSNTPLYVCNTPLCVSSTHPSVCPTRLCVWVQHAAVCVQETSVCVQHASKPLFLSVSPRRTLQ